MRILVTGGAGFIGSTIVDAYIDAGHRVWVIDDLSSGRRVQVNPKAAFFRVDVSRPRAVSAFFRGKNFDVVNHHAAQIDVRRSVADPAFDARVNILGLLNVLSECDRARVKKIIFSSSGGTIYGECPRPANEAWPENPLSPYGVAKLASEKYIKAHASLRGLRYTLFRYSNVYGPRQDPHGEAGVIAIFAQNLLTGHSSIIFGDGRQTRDFVFVKDVARANVLALTKGHNQTLNIGTGRKTSVKMLYQLMAKKVGTAASPIRKPARKGELAESVLAIHLARRILRWSPSFDLSSGLSETLAYFASHQKRK